ncbi:VOC family protein [Niabella insulamsoli]|uniref:VOC family protein n=1 Tax=Niabella insulamsoli TaxID=3144874 RepID=UPI0031FDC495
MAVINPHINFNGNAAAAFAFYKSVFGGDFTKIVRFSEIDASDYPVAEGEADKLMYIALPIGNNILIGNDVPQSMGRVNENENRSKIAISATSFAEAKALFDGLSAGGKVEVIPESNGGDSYFGMFRDKFGIEWTVAFDREAGL